MKPSSDYIDHTLNNSAAKSAYSFAKDTRFRMYFRSPNKFYDLPDVKNKRSAGFGYGNKLAIAIAKNVPSPDKYDVKGQFAKKQNKGFNFGVGREQINQSINRSIRELPGPGQYNIRKQVEKAKAKFALGIKLPQKLIIRSPGAIYNIQSVSINKHARYSLSSFKNPASFRIKTESARNRFDNKVPGPGQYTPRTTLSPNGRYFVSGLNSSRASSFSKQSRPELTKKEKRKIPGPGHQYFFKLTKQIIFSIR